MSRIKFHTIGGLFVIFPLLIASTMGKYDILAPQTCLVVVCFVVAYFLYYQQKSVYRNIWYKPSNVFVFAYLCVNFQYIVDLCLNYKGYNDFFIPQTVNSVSIIASFGLLAFVYGYFICKPKTKFDSTECHFIQSTRVISFIQVALFVAWISTANISRIVAGLTYGDNDKSTNSFESLFYCATIAMFVSVALNARDGKTDSFRSFFSQVHIANWICIISYCAIRMMSGDRGPFIYTTLAVFYTFIMVTKKHIKSTRLLFIVGGFALLVNLVGIARLSSLDQSFFERISDAFTDFSSGNSARFSDKTVSPLTEELGLSIRCNLIAVNEIENNDHSYHYGMYSLYQLIQCVPYVPSFLAKTLKIPEHELSSNILMTDIYAGGHDNFQIGTTIVADPYFDFGVIGVIIMLFFVGYCFRLIDHGICIDTPSSAINICVLILFASMAIYIPRSTFIIQIKKLIPIIVLYLINKSFNYKAK